MNERIQQLAEQATTKISFRLDPNTYKHIDDPEGDFERVEFDKQKFAELIVRECKENFAKVWYEQGVDCRGAELDKFMTRFTNILELKNERTNSRTC